MWVMRCGCHGSYGSFVGVTALFCGCHGSFLLWVSRLFQKPFFVEKHNRPSEKSLADALKGSYQSFNELVRLTDSLMQEWKFYSPKYGWTFKVFQKKKVLFYLTPGFEQFSFGMALRENEKDLVLNSSVSVGLKTNLVDGEKVMEGYPLRVEVKNEEQLTDIKKIIALLNIERQLNL